MLLRWDRNNLTLKSILIYKTITRMNSMSCQSSTKPAFVVSCRTIFWSIFLARKWFWLPVFSIQVVLSLLLWTFFASPRKFDHRLQITICLLTNLILKENRLFLIIFWTILWIKLIKDWNLHQIDAKHYISKIHLKYQSILK